MKIGYYPGCTLKTKAKNLEDSALASLQALGVEVQELERWNCCGAVSSLSDDDLIHQLAPVRDLIRARDQGCDQVMTLCSQCFNVLRRANNLMRDDAEKRKTLNLFMDEEADYAGEVEVLHYLDLLEQQVGWDKLQAAVKKPLGGMKVAPFYGCALLRPREAALGGGSPDQLEKFLTALGATPVVYSGEDECCGAYQVLVNPVEATRQAGRVLKGAEQGGAEALVLSCPLCEHNLGKRQVELAAADGEIKPLPVLYFSQLLAVALGLEPGVNHFDLNAPVVRDFVSARQLAPNA
ncbi:MAG: CoB--CoM heterodisulfide reductase iron-sulfur subunit B family protein [Pseudomonadota bacterium]